jgi:hypothetical protein
VTDLCRYQSNAHLTEKPKLTGKPQISQMTETKELGAIRRKNASG